MNKKLVFGILMLFLLSLPLLFSIFNTTFQNNQQTAINSPANLSNSAVTVTHPSNISLSYGNPTNQTISWTLNDDSPIDYLGLYSFTTDSVGTTPAGWTTTVPSGNNVQVVAGMEGHNKVVRISAITDGYPTLTPVVLSNAFTPHTSGTISFWMFPNSTGSQGCMAYVSGTGGYVFMLDFHPAGYWAWCNMGSWSSIGAGAKLRNWYHIVMTFDDTARTVQLYINGTHFTKSYCYPGLTWTPSSLDFKEYGANQYLYVDAVDYSWAPGYYPNRNQNSANKTYAIFDDGLKKTTWNAWSDQVTATYDVSGTSLGIGSHNISLIFNDLSANWYHDDVQVTVQAGDSEAPKILDVVQNPVTPLYPEAVNVTAHITDNNTVQTVLIESNSTEGDGDYLGAYSFTDDAVGTTPAGWTTTVPTGNNVKVVAGMEGHNKVVRISAVTNEYPTLTPIVLENAFTPQTSGTISFWMFPNSTGSQGCMAYVTGTGGYVFMLDFHPARYWAWCNMGSWSNIGAGAKLGCWYHIVMTFNDAAQTVQLYINGTHFTKSYCYPGLTWTPSSLAFKEYGPNEYLYVDAVDYSWAPDYYPNRNTECGGPTNCSMILTSGNQQDGEWTYTFNNYPSNTFISYRIFAQDTSGNWNVTDYYQFGSCHTINYYVPTTITIKIDIGIGASRKGDISFIFLNTGETNFVNINFTIDLPLGWTVKPSVYFVDQLAPGQNTTIKFKLTLPKNASEVSEIILIDVKAVIPELGITWTIPDPILVFVNKFKTGDLFIWIIVIVGSASAAITTTYIFIHRRSVEPQAFKTKMKGKSTITLTNALSTDIPGPLSAISMELMEKIDNLPDVTNDEKLLIIQYVSQLEEDEAIRYLDELKIPK